MLYVVQALILIKLFPTSLLLVSMFGLLDNIVRLAFGSFIGQFVDRCASTALFSLWQHHSQGTGTSQAVNTLHGS